MKLTTFLVCLFTMGCAFALVTWKRLSVDLEEELSTHAILINEAVPKVLNPHTDLIGARANGHEIIYLFRVHGFSAATMKSSKEELRADKLAFAEQDENVKRLLKSGARMTYEYFVGNDLALRFSIEEEG